MNEIREWIPEIAAGLFALACLIAIIDLIVFIKIWRKVGKLTERPVAEVIDINEITTLTRSRDMFERMWLDEVAKNHPSRLHIVPTLYDQDDDTDEIPQQLEF